MQNIQHNRARHYRGDSSRHDVCTVRPARPDLMIFFQQHHLRLALRS